MIRRALAFFILFGVQQLSWQYLADGEIAQLVVERGIVAPAAAAAARLTPDRHVYATGRHLRDQSGGINVVNGCDGMETLFLLTAAVAVAPLPRRARWLGLLCALPLVYVLNMARILGLFYAHRTQPIWFDVIHGLLAPLIMIASIAYFYDVWLRRTPRRIGA
jgi:exosortase family protein XrtM